MGQHYDVRGRSDELSRLPNLDGSCPAAARATCLKCRTLAAFRQRLSRPAGRPGRSPMHKAVSLFTLAAAAIVAAWWWLGAPVPMPPSPLDPGEKLYCVSYAPFRGQQTPARPVDPDRALADRRGPGPARPADRLRPHLFGRLRSRSVPEIAQRHGLKVLLGLWVSSHADRTQVPDRHRHRAGQAISRRHPRA